MAEIAPALTPEEWAVGSVDRNSVEANRRDDGVWALSASHCMCPIDTEDNHALAALALDGQPFGFTWEGHDALRKMLDHADRWLASRMFDDRECNLLQAARAETEKIAALLPPREEKP